MQRRQEDREVFSPGTLLTQVRAISASALRCGALQPIETRSTFVEDRGVRFLVRIVSSLREKPHQDHARNPFLPYEPPLYVAQASSSHVCILNKYKVADLHLLIVTREFEHQQCRLTLADFRALWRCLREYDSLGFYNSGPASGASQFHKHLQTVPLPLARNRGRVAVPIEPLLDLPSDPPCVLTQTSRLPFTHSLVRWNPHDLADLDRLAELSLSSYEAMLRRHQLNSSPGPGSQIEGSYNLLVTRRWMLLVPRAHECFHDISLNSLAFAGALLARDRAQFERLCERGPFAALQAVADTGAAAPK